MGKKKGGGIMVRVVKLEMNNTNYEDRNIDALDSINFNIYGFISAAKAEAREGEKIVSANLTRKDVNSPYVLEVEYGIDD